MVPEKIRGGTRKKSYRLAKFWAQVFGPLSPNGPRRQALKDVEGRKWLKALGRKKSGKGAKTFANNVKVVL